MLLRFINTILGANRVSHIASLLSRIRSDIHS